ncbi:aminotransferase [Sulfuriferula plumbiphila]|uniref:Aminotransferase n=1 Tax=Sulfuriferula plumbiphila TaxID=171865 RepID=A0A512L5I3_9PROT|nr:pyridoxal phosphate-dependent aminotransferase [Sulfuriferula plumbiphila]BBP03481.1 aminotransferase [Sulfuriferula plumbiphila]GEP29748.1 aminotransferase [Sulfuriferula plumbiphila]
MSTPHPRIAARMAGIAPFHVMDILARARQLEAQGHAIIHLEIGEPDFPTPRPIIEAGMAALNQGDLHYTPALGLPQLRSAIADFYAQHYGVQLSAQRVIVTPGASGALLLALGVLANPGDTVLLADPGYPCNRHFARFIEARTLAVPVGADTGYQLTPELVERYWAPGIKVVLLASPSNPTGTVVPDADVRAIAGICAARGATLIVDEIYHGLIYEGSYHTALAHSNQVFVVNSFSKYFQMTGWRLGWLAAPEWAIEALDRLVQNLYLAASTPAQYAALAAFMPATLAILETRKAELKVRRDYLASALRELGFDLPVLPQGAFYLYAGCGRFSQDSFAFAAQILEQTGVAITPGVDFGTHQAQRFVRFAYTTSLPDLQEAVRRLREYLQP